jgi:hypothetical protein
MASSFVLPAGFARAESTPSQGGVFAEGFFRFRDERKKRRRPPAGPEAKQQPDAALGRRDTMRGPGGERRVVLVFSR